MTSRRWPWSLLAKAAATGRVVLDDVVAWVRVWNREIAEIVEHGWLGDDEQRKYTVNPDPIIDKIMDSTDFSIYQSTKIYSSWAWDLSGCLVFTAAIALIGLGISKAFQYVSRFVVRRKLTA